MTAAIPARANAPATAAPPADRKPKSIGDAPAEPAAPKAPPFLPTMKRLLRYAAASRGRFWLSVFLILLDRILGTFRPLLIGSMAGVLAAGGPWDELQQLILVLGGLTLFLWVEGAFLERTVARVAQDALLRLRIDLVDRIQALSLDFYDRQPIGELMSGVTNDSEAVSQFFSNGFSSALSSIVQIITTLIAMLILSVDLTLVTLAVIPVVVIASMGIERVAGPAFAQLQEKFGQTSGFQEEALSGEKTIIAYNRQELASGIHEMYSAEVRDVGARAQFTGLLAYPVSQFTGSLQVALIGLVGGILVIEGNIAIAVVVSFFGYAGRLSEPISQLGQILASALKATAGASRIFAIIDRTPTVVDEPGAVDLPTIDGRVVFDHVDFSYVPGRRILHDNSFSAEPGQKIGLVGPTGAGKSTILNVLTRYYDVDSGTVTIDGHDVRTIALDSLRLQVGTVLQEPFLFSDTVMNNLRYARAGATDDDCVAAAKDANAHDFIVALPQGYQTVLTDRGANLSAGQRQMLTIARAMVADPRILILDEATSSVDTRTEKLIQGALGRLQEGRTSFVIAHRLSTIRDSAQILVIDAGRIVERGTHDELLAMDGLYRKLYEGQFRGTRTAAGSPAAPPAEGAAAASPGAG
jgi:ATP-binding cassette subfamily B protein